MPTPAHRHSIALPSGEVLGCTRMASAMWQALWRSYPEPACVGTFARMMWPHLDLPPGDFTHWTHTVAAHMTRLRRLLEGSEFGIAERQGWRYQLVTSSRAAVPPGETREAGGDVFPYAIPAGHLQPPSQRDDLGQKDAGQQHQREAVQQGRGQGFHAPQHEENR